MTNKNKNTSKSKKDNLSNNNTIKKKKKKKKSKKIYVFLLILLFALSLAVFGKTYFDSIFKNLKTTKIDKSDASVGITEDVLKDSINIALFGLDETSGTSRSDSTMVVSIDKKHNKIKLISFMRDSYVNIDGHGKDKLNHAYAYGGPQLAIKTLNQNFGLNIRDYVSIDFKGLAQIIDTLGGVELDIKPEEVNEINKYIDDVIRVTGLQGEHLKGPGVQTLTGVQAVSYSRIRHVGNGDVERTERQRKVLNELFKKVTSLGITEYPNLVKELLPYVETSLASSDIIKIGTAVLTSGITNIEEASLPLESYSKGIMKDNIWYLEFDIEATKEQVQKYINEDIKPQEKEHQE